jgi:hypothetical protein
MKEHTKISILKSNSARSKFVKSVLQKPKPSSLSPEEYAGHIGYIDKDVETIYAALDNMVSTTYSSYTKLVAKLEDVCAAQKKQQNAAEAPLKSGSGSSGKAPISVETSNSSTYALELSERLANASKLEKENQALKNYQSGLKREGTHYKMMYNTLLRAAKNVEHAFETVYSESVPVPEQLNGAMVDLINLVHCVSVAPTSSSTGKRLNGGKNAAELKRVVEEVSVLKNLLDDNNRLRAEVSRLSSGLSSGLSSSLQLQSGLQVGTLLSGKNSTKNIEDKKPISGKKHKAVAFNIDT